MDENREVSISYEIEYIKMLFQGMASSNYVWSLEIYESFCYMSR